MSLSDLSLSIDKAFSGPSDPTLSWISPQAQFDCFHPINGLVGGDAVWRNLFLPVRSALTGIRRKTDIAMEGVWTSQKGESQIWVSMTGHLLGQHVGPLFGLPPSHRLTSIRFGEFYRLEDSKIVEAKVLWDLPALFAQCGRPLFPASGGQEWLTPGPILQDGLVRTPECISSSLESLELVEAMIRGLMAYDGQHLESMGMNRFWSDDMLWHGPWGIGSSSGLTGFQDVHQRPFLHAFPDRKGGNHSARFADGPYVCSAGWPSIRATHRGEYLGHKASGRPITMRVMDWWRVSGGRLSENWVLIDLPDLFLQMGHDILE